MSLPSGGHSERGPHVGIPLDTFHSVTSVGLPPYLAGPQFSPQWITYGGNLPSPNDNDGCFPLGVGSGFQGMTGLRCLFRQVPHLTHNGLELRVVHLALTHFLLFLMHSHVIVKTHINRQGGFRSRTRKRHARQLLHCYVPKVLSTSFCSHVVVLQAFSPFPSSEGDDLHLLCPVRALKMYVDCSSQWRQSLQLLVCFGAGRKGLAASKHTISHWVRDAIFLAYEVRSLPSPLDIRAHSTRGVASSTALFRGVPLEDICMVPGRSSPHTFVKFYNLDVNTAPGSQVLSA